MHRRASAAETPGRLVPALCAVGLAGLLIGATAAVLNLGAVTDASASSTAATSRGQDHAADRGARPAVVITASHAGQPGPTPRSTTHPAGASVAGACQASFYSDGQRTANGETFDPNALTAANKTLPFNTRVLVTNKANGKSVVVRINDRGPYVAGRCLDLSRAAFAAIANLSSGVINVTYAIVS